MSDKYAGRCLCGAVTYAVTGSPAIVAQCHCNACRKLSGTGHTVGAMFLAGGAELRGPLREFKYQSDKASEVTKGFCGECGSPIYGKNSNTPEYITFSLGTMDDASDLRVQVVIFARDKQHWDALGDDVMAFETQPEWTPEG
jgi:hypothetical protein